MFEGHCLSCRCWKVLLLCSALAVVPLYYVAWESQAKLWLQQQGTEPLLSPTDAAAGLTPGDLRGALSHNGQLKVVVKDVKSGEWRDTGHRVVKGCSTVPRELFKFHSQSHEDTALLERYFSKPLICNGTFVEIGALDGILISNTKFFEDTLHWNGVLIEAQPQNYARLLRNRPRVTTFGEAICPRGQDTVEFVDAGGSNEAGGVPQQMTDGHYKAWVKNPRRYKVPCRPIGDLLKAADVRAVDLFSLDVEGAELMVLETMDWSVAVKVFVVEMGRGARDQQLIDLLSQQGFRLADWNIRDYCRKGQSCTDNQVFENINYKYAEY